MREHPYVACVGLIFFWCEGCFWFGCLLSLSSACAGRYPLDRGCAGVWPTWAPGKAGAVFVAQSTDPQWQQQSMPASGVQGGNGGSHLPSELQ